jgi:5'-AMP-activated protein kinase regulatory beta subunit
MGSASSKENDANPSDLGTNSGAYPMHHHPYYSQGGQPYSGYNAAGGRGDAATDAHGDPSNLDGGKAGDDAMDVDTPSAPASDYSLDGSAVTSTNEQGGQLLVVNEEVVPMVFKWEHGGRNVYITGTFNGWSKQCPMHRSGNDFTYIANLTRGKHAYKFVVDDEWRFAPDQLTVTDVEGNVNNFVDVSDFAALADFAPHNPKEDDEDTENPYSRYIPEIDEYTKEPPPLPPQLRHIILNKVRIGLAAGVRAISC